MAQNENSNSGYMHMLKLALYGAVGLVLVIIGFYVVYGISGLIMDAILSAVGFALAFITPRKVKNIVATAFSPRWLNSRPAWIATYVVFSVATIYLAKLWIVPLSYAFYLRVFSAPHRSVTNDKGA